MMKLFVALLLCATAAAAQSATPPAGYRVHQSANAVSDGSRFELLENLHISDEGAPMRLAIVRVVSRSGVEHGRLMLERATADMHRVALSRKDSAVAVSVDLSADAGSYSGPVVRFLSVDQGRLSWTQAVDSAGHRSDLLLPTTLKTAWRIDSRAARPEILLVACRPDLSRPASDTAAAFVITYSRFYLDGGIWHRVDRRVRGIWENDGDFPKRALFP